MVFYSVYFIILFGRFSPFTRFFWNCYNRAFSLILNTSMIQPLVILEVIIQYNTTFTHVIIGSFYYDLITMTLKQWRELQFKTIFTKSVIYILV